MAELLDAHKARIAQLVERSLDVIEGSLVSKRVFVTKDGGVIDGGEDAFARLAAVKRLVEMIQAARSEQVQERSMVTYEEFVRIWEAQAK